MSDLVTMLAPQTGISKFSIDGVFYPVIDDTVTLPRRYLSELLDSGWEDVSNTHLGMWDDVPGTIDQGVGSATLDFLPWRDTLFRLWHFRSNQADELHFGYQMKHGWNLGVVRPHLHFAPVAAPVAAQVFAVKGEYAWADAGYEIPAAAGWTAFTAQADVAPGDENFSRILMLASVQPGAHAAPSSILLIRIARDFAGADTYDAGAAANIALISADTHYQSKQYGTQHEF